MFLGGCTEPCGLPWNQDPSFYFSYQKTISAVERELVLHAGRWYRNCQFPGDKSSNPSVLANHGDRQWAPETRMSCLLLHLPSHGTSCWSYSFACFRLLKFAYENAKLQPPGICSDFRVSVDTVMQILADFGHCDAHLLAFTPSVYSP